MSETELNTEDILNFNQNGDPSINVNQRGSSGVALQSLGRQLLEAAGAGDAARLDSLLARGAPFAADWLGTTPLHLAAAAGSAPAVAALLAAGVSRDARTKVERTPLQLSCYHGHTAVTTLLLANGADPRAADLLGMTALHWAAERGHAGDVAALLAAGASVTARCRFQRTALQCAASDAIRDLLQQALDEQQRGTLEKENNEAVSQMESEYVTAEEPAPSENITYLTSNAENTEQETESTTFSAGNESGAARLLRQHGITLLDASCPPTVLAAVRAGRRLRLSEACKWMLKESQTSPTVVNKSPTKVIKRVVNQPFVKVKYVNVSPGTRKIQRVARIAPNKTSNGPMRIVLDKESLNKLIKMGVTSVSNPDVTETTHISETQIQTAGHTDTNEEDTNLMESANLNSANVNIVSNENVKIVNSATFNAVDNSNMNIVDNTNVISDVNSTNGATTVVVPEQFLVSTDVEYLRAQLLSAHAQLSRARAELAELRGQQT